MCIRPTLQSACSCLSPAHSFDVIRLQTFKNILTVFLSSGLKAHFTVKSSYKRWIAHRGAMLSNPPLQLPHSAKLWDLPQRGLQTVYLLQCPVPLAFPASAVYILLSSHRTPSSQSESTPFQTPDQSDQIGTVRYYGHRKRTGPGRNL